MASQGKWGPLAVDEGSLFTLTPATPTLAPFRLAPRIYDQERAKEWGFADPRSLTLRSTDLRPREG